MPSSAETASENDAESHAGFSFSVDFVSKTHRQPAAMEKQPFGPVINFGGKSNRSAPANQNAPSLARASTAPHGADFEFWKTFQSSSDIKAEFWKAGTPAPTNNNSVLKAEAEADTDENEKVAAKYDRENIHGATATIADRFQGQAPGPASPKTHSPPRLNNFSFSSETLKQPDFSGLPTPSLMAAHPTNSISPTSRFAFSGAAIPNAQTKTAPLEENIV